MFRDCLQLFLSWPLLPHRKPPCHTVCWMPVPHCLQVCEQRPRTTDSRISSQGRIFDLSLGSEAVLGRKAKAGACFRITNSALNRGPVLTSVGSAQVDLACHTEMVFVLWLC